MIQHLQALPPVNYEGKSGIAVICQLQSDLTEALNQEDWGRVQHLDMVCALVVDRVIAANRDNKSTLINALNELKGVYSKLISQCHHSADCAHNL